MEQSNGLHQRGDNPKPLVIKDDEKQYPKNPENGYVSRLPTAFRGCLCCGQVRHQFNTFPQISVPDEQNFIGKSCGTKFIFPGKELYSIRKIS